MLTAWARLPTEAITKSFKSFALNLAVDGSQDSEIHCFKKGHPCEVGAEQLKAQLSVLDEPTLPDPFQAITNSDIEEAGDENTMVLDEDSDVDIGCWHWAIRTTSTVPFSATLYRYGFVDGLDLSADGLDSLLQLCHLDYYNTVFRLPCYMLRLSLLHASYVLNAPPPPLFDPWNLIKAPGVY